VGRLNEHAAEQGQPANRTIQRRTVGECAMAPSFLNFKELRRRSKASFRTDGSTDASSDGSHANTPTTGSLTPPSVPNQSDPNLDLHVKDQLDGSLSPPPVPLQSRPHISTSSSGSSNRQSVSGMTGLGSPVLGGRGPSLPVSPFSPRITNMSDNAWVSQVSLQDDLAVTTLV
jgi:hypothetical protein